MRSPRIRPTPKRCHTSSISTWWRATPGARCASRAPRSALACLFAAALAVALPHGHAEQFIEIGDFSAHYMILDTLSLEPEIAERYGIVRARTSSILTLSILDEHGDSVSARVSGAAINLLGNKRSLDFQAIQEGEAHYSIASIQHTEEEMRFELSIETPDGVAHQVRLRQRLYSGIE